MNPAAEARTSDATLVVLAEEIDDAISAFIGSGGEGVSGSCPGSATVTSRGA
jgi:hypothetical protein